MDLDPTQCTQDDESVGYEISNTKEEEYNANNSSVKSDHSYCSEDLSKSHYLDSDNNIDEEFYKLHYRTASTQVSAYCTRSRDIP